MANFIFLNLNREHSDEQPAERGVGSNPVQNFHAVDVGHHDIQDARKDGLSAEDVDGFPSILGCDHFEPKLLEAVSRQAQQEGFVIGDENAFPCCVCRPHRAVRRRKVGQGSSDGTGILLG